MKLTFIGADHEVTGSCHMLSVGGKNVIVDCGMEQGPDYYENQEIPVKPSDLDAILVTHAHIDHTGKLPLLVKNGFQGKIFSTSATAQLCDIMLQDSAHIQEFEAEWKNRKAKRSGAPPVEPMYSVQDAQAAAQLFVPCPYGTTVDICEGIQARFTDVGHLLGSSCIEVWATEEGVTKKILFSGDIGNKAKPILRDPQTVDEADYVLIESTYGDRDHEVEGPDYVGDFTSILRRTFERGGNVVVPCFAVGRTQEVLYFIREIKTRDLLPEFPDFEVYVDSPLANRATTIFTENEADCFDEDAMALVKSGINPLVFPGLKMTITSDESKAINEDNNPKVILSASGMCDAGRIRHHLKHNLWRADSTICFVGYQAEGTVGRRLIDGETEVTLFGEKIQVQAEIVSLKGVSGHADRTGLLDWLGGLKKAPKKVFVVHGEDEVTDSFAGQIKERFGYETYAPYSGAEYDIVADELTLDAQPVPIVKEEHRERGGAAAEVSTREADINVQAAMDYEKAGGDYIGHQPAADKAKHSKKKGKGKQEQKQYRKRPEYNALVAELRRLEKVVADNEGLDNADLKKFTEQMRVLAETWKI